MSLPEILQDSAQKYANTTIAKLVGDGFHTAEPFFVNGTDEGRTRVRFTGQTLFGKDAGWSPAEISIGEADAHAYLLTVPLLGVFNVRDVTIHLVRHPNRQWQRGYHERVITLSSLNHDEYKWVGKRLPGAQHPDLLWELFNPVYPSCDEAFSLVSSLDYMARAWNRTYHYVMKRTLPHVMVAHNTHIIGYRIDDVIYLSSNYAHLREELGEFCKLEILEDAKQESKDSGEHVGAQAGDTTVQVGRDIPTPGGVRWTRDRAGGMSEQHRAEFFRALERGSGRLSAEPRDGAAAQPPTLWGGPLEVADGPIEMGEGDGEDGPDEDLDSDF